MNEVHEHFEIMSELLTVKDMPSFRFVLNKRTLNIVSAWDVNGKYYPRGEFNIDMEKIAKEKEGKKHNNNFHNKFNMRG